MDPRFVDGDLGYLYKYASIKNQTASGFENDLTLTLNALHRQIMTAGIVRVDWEQERGEEHLVLAEPAEQVFLLTELLRVAEQTDKKNVKLTTRCVLTDRLFEEKTAIGRLNSIHRNAWLKKPHDYEIDPKKDQRAAAEEVRKLQGKLTAQDEELARLRELIHAMKLDGNDAMEIEPSQRVVTIDDRYSSKRTVKTERGEAEPLGDQEYFERMVEEVQESDDLPGLVDVSETDEENPEELEERLDKPGEHKPAQQVADEREEEELDEPEEEYVELESVHFESDNEIDRRPIYADPPHQWAQDRSIRWLSDQVEQLQQVLHVLGAFCDAMGRHFSDSCPEATEGGHRRWIVNCKQLCNRCLGMCLPNRCKFKPRKCWYCEKIRGTIVEDLIPADNHHRALCTVPDLRSVVRGRLTRKQEELEMQQSMAWNCGGQSVVKPTHDLYFPRRIIV
ncbi:unnamed protein product [Heligmosomoides polygyrus]|uniref:TRAF-type domain-containing protein n=1 Tax=Heligmosomoides polygyrus TaxID=6339 RepID=A0A183G7P5_HELPZ|nr:unnamed protein product [Heligmosomoides polygyrus]